MPNDPNSEILTESELTVKAAKKELNKTLDYSKTSFNTLEALIQHVKTYFSNLKKDGKLTEQTIQRASVSIGAYLGEVIRRHHGGSWIAKNAVMKTLVINGQGFSPILYVFQRLTKDSDFSLENYWSDVRQKLYPPEKIDDQVPIVETLKKTTNSLKGNRSLIIGGVIGLAILCFIGILAVTIYSNIKRTNEFKAKTNTFLVQADKLNVMTGQGVTYQEFRSQLVEVKSTYASIDNWPSSHRDEKIAFDKAVEGWDLTLEIWKLGINDPNIDFDMPVAAYFGGSLIDQWCQYIGADISTCHGLSIQEWIEELMGLASNYFEAGKAGVK